MSDPIEHKPQDQEESMMPESTEPATPVDVQPKTSDDTEVGDVSAPAQVFPAGSAAAMGPAIPVEVTPAEAGEGKAAPQSSKSAAASSDSAQAGEAAEEEEVQSGPQSPFGPLNEQQQNYPWYVVNTYSGFEMNAKKNLEERIRANNLIERFGHVLIPQETVVELVRGQKKTSTRKFFPGYMLVQCDLDDETWHMVNGTPKVTGFVGDPRNPSPLSAHEVENLLKQMEGGAARPRPKVQFEQGDAIKVIDGPFTDFNGTVDEVRPDKGKLRVLISIFGRNTPVELDFVQVEKA